MEFNGEIKFANLIKSKDQNFRFDKKFKDQEFDKIEGSKNREFRIVDLINLRTKKRNKIANFIRQGQKYG